jgi:putative ABC transport system substrate-binding protein
MVTLILVVLMALQAAEAQPRGKMPLLGVLEPGHQQLPTPSICHAGFRQGLHDLGYMEEQNLRLVYRYAEEKAERLPILADELVQLAPDILWAYSNAAAWALKQATSTIPIVAGAALDLLEQGLVESLGRPGGNLTGMDIRDVELAGKRLELLKEALPTVARVAVLVNPATTAHAHVPGHITAEARALGVQLQRVEAQSPEAFETAFAAMRQGGAEALMIMENILFGRHRHRLLELALQYRLPTMSGGRHFAEAGSLLAYGGDVHNLCQRSTVLVDKILKGAKPGDLPVEQPTTFKLVVNLKTAEALGLTLSPLFLVQADEVLR